MGGGDQRGVVVTAEVGAALVVVEAELALELLVVELDLPAHPGQARESLGLGVGGQVGDPVVGGLVVTFGPFGDQPFLARGYLGALAPPAASLVVAPAVCGVNAREDEPGGDRLAVGPVAEGDRLRGGRSEPADQLADRLGLRSGRGRTGPRVASGFLAGTANRVPCSNTFVFGPTDSTYRHSARSRRSRSSVFSP